MPVVRVVVDHNFDTAIGARHYADTVRSGPHVFSAEVLDDDTPKMPDPMMVSGMLRAAADYAVMLAEALDKLNAQQSGNRDVTP